MTAFADYELRRLLQGAPDNDGGLLTLSSPTNLIGAGNDGNAGYTVPFGFDFDYDGTTYTQADAYVDGVLLFAGHLAGSDTWKQYLFDDARNQISLHPWQAQLETANSGGYLRYEQLGSAPSRYVVIEWKCHTSNNQNAFNNQTITFQVVLRETTNNIEFRYAASSITGSTSGFYAPKEATIGARVDTTGTIAGNIREFTEQKGTPDANGGVSTLPVEMGLDALTEYPGDGSNVIEGAAFNLHFLATVPAAAGDPAPPPPASSPGALSATGAYLSSPAWDPVPPFRATGDPDTRPSLAELVFISLFSWARAEPGDALPTTSERLRGLQGWWAERYGEDEADRFGSRLWLLQRAKDTAANKQLAADYARDSLQWLIDDGIAAEVEVSLYDQLRKGVGLIVTITRGDGSTETIRYPRFWERVTGG